MLPELNPLSVVFLATGGLVMGSFLATVALRLPLGQSIVFGRSHCDVCGRVLRPWQLIPVLGWIAQRGRCHFCRMPVSPLYLVTEIGAATVCLWSLVLIPPPYLWPSIGLGWVLLTLAVMDWRYLVLSDALTLPLLGFGLGVTWFFRPDALSGHLWGAVAGAAVLYAINGFYRYFRQRDGLGLGDVKLAGAAGAWLGWKALPSVFVVACALALIVLLVQRRFGAMIDWKLKLAFGSYLCFSVWVVWLYGPIGWG